MTWSIEVADRLEALFEHFAIRAQMFHAGTLCGNHQLTPDGDTGQLHLIRRGRVLVHQQGADELLITSPSLLLYPRPLAHRFVIDEDEGAELACAQLRFDGGSANPIAATLPAFVCLPLDQISGASGVLALIFEEAFQQRCGRRALLDRLFAVVLIQILRHLMDSGHARIGMLGGLAHPKLRLALVAMHERPAHDWGLDDLASTAGMSRSAFANGFRVAVGCTPGVYLQRWRIALVQKALQQGRSLKLIASEVGYGDESALSRSFKASCGLSPRDWKHAQTRLNAAV